MALVIFMDIFVRFIDLTVLQIHHSNFVSTTHSANNSRSIDRLLVRSLALPNQVRAYLKTSRTMWQLAECISKTTGIIKAQKKHTREKKDMKTRAQMKIQSWNYSLWIVSEWIDQNLVKYACNTKHKMMQRNRDRDEMKWTSPNVGDDKCNLHLNRRTN